MTEYRIVEEHRRFAIQVSVNGHDWRGLHDIPHVPRFFDSLADARSWVATIKKGVVYHDAEDALSTVTSMWERYSAVGQEINATSNHDKSKDAPNLAQDERKAEDDTSSGIKPLEWFEERIGKDVTRINNGGYFDLRIWNRDTAKILYNKQKKGFIEYSDPRWR